LCIEHVYFYDFLAHSIYNSEIAVCCSQTMHKMVCTSRPRHQILYVTKFWRMGIWKILMKNFFMNSIMLTSTFINDLCNWRDWQGKTMWALITKTPCTKIWSGYARLHWNYVTLCDRWINDCRQNIMNETWKWKMQVRNYAKSL